MSRTQIRGRRGLGSGDSQVSASNAAPGSRPGTSSSFNGSSVAAVNLKSLPIFPSINEALGIDSKPQPPATPLPAHRPPRAAPLADSLHITKLRLRLGGGSRITWMASWRAFRHHPSTSPPIPSYDFSRTNCFTLAEGLSHEGATHATRAGLQIHPLRQLEKPISVSREKFLDKILNKQDRIDVKSFIFDGLRRLGTNIAMQWVQASRSLGD
ncbi:hypothetical protein M407DRAFT_28796 [Tulasnella calospora MUT 4182]|uniref:Uncharacterized protein n=1 Tax=Tulasnella calospora MUT 4182 TaxID=1051891 RepID=A0A0C3LJK5_9AGAM|nr:hypothetical protein M407DRAFT_28796 [Tulasnella calospora MUT 4182]